MQSKHIFPSCQICFNNMTLLLQMSAPASLSPFQWHLAHSEDWRVLYSLYITSINLFNMLQDLAVAMTVKAIKSSRGRCLYSGTASRTACWREGLPFLYRRRKTFQHRNSHLAEWLHWGGCWTPIPKVLRPRWTKLWGRMQKGCERGSAGSAAFNEEWY